MYRINLIFRDFEKGLGLIQSDCQGFHSHLSAARDIWFSLTTMNPPCFLKRVYVWSMVIDKGFLLTSLLLVKFSLPTMNPPCFLKRVYIWSMVIDKGFLLTSPLLVTFSLTTMNPPCLSPTAHRQKNSTWTQNKLLYRTVHYIFRNLDQFSFDDAWWWSFFTNQMAGFWTRAGAGTVVSFLSN